MSFNLCTEFAHVVDICRWCRGTKLRAIMMLRAAGATAPAPLRRDEIAMEIMIGRVIDVDVDASFNAAFCSVEIGDC